MESGGRPLLVEDRRAGAHELADHPLGIGHEAAGVAAEVDDQLPASGRDGRRYLLAELAGRAVAEAAQPDIADGSIGEGPGHDLALDDDVADDGQLDRRGDPTHDREDDRRALGPRTLASAWSAVRPLTVVPSIAVDRSPARTPAFSAGAPAIGSTTTSPHSSSRVGHAPVPLMGRGLDPRADALELPGQPLH